MSRWSALWRNLVHRERVERDLDQELRATLELLVDEKMRGGMAPEAAWREARLQLGHLEPLKERVRDVRAGAAIEVLIQDVRYALRLLRRSPGFTAVALLTLAVGIGANTTMFSIVNGVLLRPLPYPDAEQLVRLYLVNVEQGVSDGMVSPPDFDLWQSQADSVSAMAAYQEIPVILAGRGEPVEVQATFARGAFFETLGAPPLLGRALTADDLRRATTNAVISERLWRTHFAADPTVIGQSLRMMARAFTIVGVMPADFRYPTADTEVWAPRAVLNATEIGPDNRNQRVLEAIARLRSGVAVEQAGAQLSTLAAGLAAQFPETNTGWHTVHATPLHTTLVGDVSNALLVALAMVGVTLLIGCVNLANLMLARGPARAGEIAIRAALGAGRLRIVRQILTESVVLAGLGGALGIALSVWGLQAVLALSADTLPRIDDVRVDGGVIAFGLLLVVATGTLFGVLPAMRAARGESQATLRNGRGTVGGGHRLRDMLVVAEVGLAVVIVVGAVLMTRSFVALRGVDPGFDPDRVLSVSMLINVTGARDVGAHITAQRRLFIDRIAALPGVVDVGAVNSLPLEGGVWEWFDFRRADGTGMPDGSPLRADRSYVDGGYLRAMNIPLHRGQPLLRDRSQWTPGTPLPILANETAARRFWPNEEAVGQIVRAPWGTGVIAGVVGDVRHLGLAQAPTPAVYFPHFVGPRVLTTLVARTDGEPAALAGAVRQAIRDLDPNQPIRRIAPLDEVMAESVARDRFFTVVFVVFGALALVLAAIGVYGVLAYSVGQRTREIGVRMAMGARGADILRMVIGGGMRLVATGVMLGCVAAWFLTRALSSQLYGVSPTDPMTFFIAPVTLAVVALIACYLPARRAVRIQPVTALRDG
jgi:predicted permease